MSSPWTYTEEDERLGIVIYNFQQEGLHRLKLRLGETVFVLQENENWYYGFCTTNPNVRGVFPKSFVQIRPSTIDRSGLSEEVVFEQHPLVHEITSVLREWGHMLRNLYIYNDEHFNKIRVKIYELIKFCNEIKSGKFPVDEMKQKKRIVTSKIDVGNKLLGLDMVVRDEHGNILNPDLTSTIQLYRHHKLTTERIIKATSEPPSREEKKPLTHQYSHALFLSLSDFICKMGEDAELLLCLYDAKDMKPFTENFVVRWSKGSESPELEHSLNHRVLFTDLGTRDLQREKVYLVCYAIRCGGMDKATVPKTQDVMRRPFGVAAKDITLYINGKIEPKEENTLFVPLLSCEKDTLDGTLKRLMTIKDLTQKDHKGQGLNVRLKMLHGDLKQVREENAHLMLGQVYMARKMGFPEVILPGDVRNDLYLSLISGEFSKGSKTTDKNVQVSVHVCNSLGEVLPDVVQLGAGVTEESEFRSVIYYHEDKPRWSETFKIAVPIEDFKVSHLKFTFKHRSSNETKDKNEKPFALSYVKLMLENGTTLPDGTHELLVYKVDHKKYNPLDVGYLSLPSTKNELEDGSKPSTNGLSLSSKDSFNIQTNVCSTKLTQNVDLLGLLNWTSQTSKLHESLKALNNVSGEEIVKFLQDVLDALFNILMHNPDSNSYDEMVFSCLLYIIGLVSHTKFEHFQPVLDLYIKESFCATLAYSKLILVLKDHIDRANVSDSSEREVLLKTMKSLQYCIKFIVRSRVLFSELNDGKDEEEFFMLMNDLLTSISSLMCYNNDVTLLVQGACLKYLPSAIPDIMTVFSPSHFSHHLKDLVDNVPPMRLSRQKLTTIRDIIHSPIFLSAECRHILLPVFLSHIKILLEVREENTFKNMELCIEILSDIMDLLFRDDVGSTLHDLSNVMRTILRTVIQGTIAMDREVPLVGNLVAVMLSIMRQMASTHFSEYIKHFATSTDLLDFLMEILLVFKDLVSRPVYPRDWCEMIMLQNSIILKSLRYFSETIRDYFTQRFEQQAWNNFFHCAISFLTQPALQLENFSVSKKKRIIARYKDMRLETSIQIRSMWFSLGQYKKNFIPGLVGPFLEMTLIPEPELRQRTLDIFFDMIQSEFYSTVGKSRSSTKDLNIKANFHEFEKEMILKLDNLVEGGRGDDDYKVRFNTIISKMCEKHSILREQGLKFVKIVTGLMERLLEYRSIITDENKENRMSCIVNLLDFYCEINRREMYIRYLNKLCDLHLECDNYTEAAYTLQLHSKLLEWSDNSLPHILRNSKYPHCTTHRQLKDALYHDIIKYFDSGKMWECAVEVCKELARQYEEHTYDLPQLSALLKTMATFYDNIMQIPRQEPEYFRVAYYGRGFPPFLQNKVFIYRGKQYDRLSDFCTRTLNQHPKAELMNTLTPPGEDITESSCQYIQINKVEPIMDEKMQKALGPNVCPQILKYHKVNNVQKFKFSRPYHKKDSESDNEFASLWLERNVLVTSYPLPGILGWFPVTSTQVMHVSPLANAIETMRASNESLRELVMEYKKDPTQPLNPLSMRLNGIVDAGVMGGVNNYEKAFCTPEYLEKHPEHANEIDQLKDLIASQIPLLEVAIKTHGDVAPAMLHPLHNRIVQCFEDMQAHVTAKYGVKSCDIKYEPVQMRRQSSLNSSHNHDSNRLSGTSFGSTEGSRSRVSSLTRSQVASLITFVNFASMSPSSTLTRAGSVYVKSGSLSSTPTMRKEKKKKRRHTNKERDSIDSGIAMTTKSSSQWYTSPAVTPTSTPTPSIEEPPPVFELRQQLTPTRPLRSEMEKERRQSRPPSGQFQSRLSLPSINGNRDSIGTTDSTASEDDPPPLPAKTREADYCNLPDNETPHVPTVRILSPRLKNKPVPPLPIECPPSLETVSDRPPTPPPKRPSSVIRQPPS